MSEADESAAPNPTLRPATRADKAALQRFRCWTDGEPSFIRRDTASAHLMCATGADTHHVLDRARQVLAVDYDITHATFQVEPDTHDGCQEVSW